MPTRPATCLTAIAPSRADLVGCVAWIFPWYRLAALGARAGRPLVLGQALSRQALHDGKAKHDQSDAQKIAVVLRGGLLPHAEVSPAAMRATRDL